MPGNDADDIRNSSVKNAEQTASSWQCPAADADDAESRKQTTRKAVVMATTPSSLIGHVALRLPENGAKMGLGPTLRTAKNG